MSEIKYFLVRERDGPVQRSIIPSQAVADHRGRAVTRGRDCSRLRFFLLTYSYIQESIYTYQYIFGGPDI